MKLGNRILILFLAVSILLYLALGLTLAHMTSRRNHKAPATRTRNDEAHITRTNNKTVKHYNFIYGDIVYLPPTLIPGNGAFKQEDWQTVTTGSINNFIIYSAYSLFGDDNVSPEVLIIGITTKKMEAGIHCKFYLPAEDDGKRSTIQIAGKIKKMTLGDSGWYAGVFVTCPLPISKPSWKNKPELVSVLLNKEVNPSNYIQIQYLNEPKNTNYQFNFSVCAKPAFNLNNVAQLLEWIEFYKLMGVKQFTLYNMTIGAEASCILRDLMEGKDPSLKVNVYPWHDQQILDKFPEYGNVPQHAIAAAQNDCVYRHRGRRSKYMAFVDLDEFIMPSGDKAQNFQEMIDLLHAQGQGQNYGEYQFRNGFFVISRPDDPLLLKRCSGYRENPLSYRICKDFKLKKVLKDDDQRYGTRTKYIIKPEGVKEAVKQGSNHFVLEFESGYESYWVPESIGFLSHYQEFQEGNHTERDQVALEFGMELAEKISQRMEYYRKICNLTMVNK